MTETPSQWDKLWSGEDFGEPLYDKAAYERGKRQLNEFFQETGEEGRTWLGKKLRDSFDKPATQIADDMVQYRLERLERIENERMQQFQAEKIELLAKRAVYAEAISHFRTGAGIDLISPERAAFKNRNGS